MSNPYANFQNWHPDIFPGLNSAAVNTDELNGAGVNDTLFPDLVSDTPVPLVMAHQGEYWNEVDLRVAAENRTILVPVERREIMVRA